MRDSETLRLEKLPFWQTVGRAYAMPLGHMKTVGRVIWLWLGLLAPVLLLLSWFLAPALVDAWPKVGTPDPDVNHIANQLTGVTLPIASPDSVRESSHFIEHRVDLWHHVLTIHHD